MLALVAAAGLAVAFTSYVYAGSPTTRSGRDSVKNPRRIRIDPSALGTISPRALNIIRGERDVDVSVETDAAPTGLPPGVSAGVSALGVPGRPPASVPSEVRSFVSHMVRMTQTDERTALAGIRELRSGLGTGNAAVYAFRSSSGSPCFILTGYGGACAQSPRDGTPGLHWTIGGGHETAPSVLVGIAGDDVRRVDLRVDGAAVPVSLSNNVVFAEFPSSGKQATIVVVHDGGGESRATLRL